MRLFGAITSLILLYGSPMLAAEKGKSDEPDTEKPPADKTYHYAAAGDLLFAGTGLGAGAEFWAFGPDRELGGFLFSTSGDTKGDKDDKDADFVVREYIDARTLGIGAKARQFWGGTFFLSPALSYVRVDGRYGYQVVLGDSDAAAATVATKFSASALWATLGVGNQWRWDDNGTVIGCDWIGLGSLIGSRVNADATSEDGETVDIVTEHRFGASLEERLKKVLGKTFSFYALQLHVGKQF